AGGRTARGARGGGVRVGGGEAAVADGLGPAQHVAVVRGARRRLVIVAVVAAADVGQVDPALADGDGVGRAVGDHRDADRDKVLAVRPARHRAVVGDDHAVGRAVAGPRRARVAGVIRYRIVLLQPRRPAPPSV